VHIFFDPASSKGNLLVFSRADAKKTASIPRAGIAAAPTPMNIPSLKAESGGKDVAANLVPLGGSGVWSSSAGSGAAAAVPGASATSDASAPSSSSAAAAAAAGQEGSGRPKVAPWASSRSQGSDSSAPPSASQAPSSTGPSAGPSARPFGSIKMRSWADDESDEERGPEAVAEKPSGAQPGDFVDSHTRERERLEAAPRAGDTVGYGSEAQRFGPRSAQGGANLTAPSSASLSGPPSSSWRRGPQDSEGPGGGYYGRDADHYDNQAQRDREPFFGRGGGFREEEVQRYRAV
jgi:hypothetical protein